MSKHFMKATTATLLIILCTTFNSIHAQIRLGIEAGYINSNFIDKSDNPYISLSSINNFLVGAKADMPLSKRWSFQSGLTYVVKGGYKGTTEFALSGSSSTIKLNYLQMPFNLKYQFLTKTNIKPFIGGGLYLAAGLSGTEKGYYESSPGSTTPIDEKIVFSNNSSGTVTTVKPVDAGYNLLAGATWKDLQLQLGYNKGFSRVFTSGNTNIVNAVFNISLAYMFKAK